MEGKNKLHIKISTKAIAFLFVSIIILSILTFVFARNEIKQEYIKRLETPGKLITDKVVGFEIINDRKFIESVIEEDIVQCVIIGKDGKIYYSTTASLIGKDSWEVDDLYIPSTNKETRKIKREIQEKIKYFTSIVPLKNEADEDLGYLYIKTDKSNFRKELMVLFIVFTIVVIGILIISYLYISHLIKSKVSIPLNLLMDSSKELNQGNLSFELNKIKSNDEFKILEEHNNEFVKGLRDKTRFADEIEKKNFDFTYNPLSEKDELGKALVELRNSLQKATEEEVARTKLDEINKWITNGVARFSEILRKDIENMEQLGYSVISNLVDYLGANQGGFFLIEENQDGEKIIDLKAAYALNRKKHFQKTLSWGEGLIGSCLLEGKTTYLTNLPENYIRISSGLGESNPRSLIIIPLQLGDVKYGALEIASFKKMEDHQLDFINRISEIIASTISTVKNNIRTQRLLDETNEQSEKIKQAEEELRQNIEEMHATQEEVERTNSELRKNELELTQKAAELEKEKYLMDALLENIPEFIYFKDKESKFLKNSLSHVRNFGARSAKEIEGKSDFDFFSKEHAQPAYEAEQKIIATGEPIIDFIEKETREDGRVTWVTTTKMALRNKEGEIVGTFGISKDITEIKNLEQEALKSKENLEFENTLFTTLMDNISARVTYKDKEARYIRINETKVKALNIKKQEEVLGKTDIDIFGDSHSKEALQNEIDNISKGLSSLNNVELIKYKDGTKSWGSTSRIPLKNKEGDILGGLVITWDITNEKNAGFEIDMFNNLIAHVSANLPVVYFKMDSNHKIISIEGKGIKELGFTNKTSDENQFSNQFPEIIKRVKKIKEEDNITIKEKIKIKNITFEVSHYIITNKTTVNGYTGYTLLTKK